MLDKATGRSRGFGFVTFTNKADMEECIAKLHGTELDGRKISVTRAIPQSEIAPGAPVGRTGGYSGGGGGRDRWGSLLSGVWLCLITLPVTELCTCCKRRLQRRRV